jgi:preprotein translocase subunit SecD
VIVVEVPEDDAVTLRGLGDTRRLEERQVLETVAPSVPAYATTPLTPIDPSTGSFSFADPNGGVVSFEDTSGDGAFTDGIDVKYRLGKVEFTSADVEEAHAGFVTSFPGWRVTFTLTGDGSRKFAEATTRLTGEQLAILVDGMVLSAPSVLAPITGGQGEITGSRSKAEAKDLAAALDAPPLPVALQASSPMAARVDAKRRSPVAGVATAGLGAAGLVWGLRRRPHARSRIRRDQRPG